MQYIAGNNTPTRSYHSVTPNAPSPEGGGGVSEMLLENPTLLDILQQQSGQCGSAGLRVGLRQLVAPSQLFFLNLPSNWAAICYPV